MKLRLDKYLADLKLGTRTEVKKAIANGRVLVNSEVLKNPAYKIDTEKDQIHFDGKSLQYEEFYYYLFHKPAGCVTANKDNLHPTIMEYLEGCDGRNLSAVGRLDLDTEGLLLITNDGVLSHAMLSPRGHVPKKYFAKIDGLVTEEDVNLFEKGVDIGEKSLTAPAKLHICKAEEQSEIELVITEGKYHQVKRMFDVIGKPVLYLKRIEFGKFVLDNSLQKGTFRKLTEEELAYVKEYKSRFI